jgi:alpha-galactosidase
MTKYRRHIAGKSVVDAYLPAIFNEYMHLSWDSPTAENTKKLAPIVAKTGVEYYVIDCGWHNEEPGNIIYPFVGQWKESKARFPEGVRKTTDYIRSLGMKAGLWIEPEIIGCQCQEMLDYYDDDCFLQRNGKRLCIMGRHFLDFRAKKVVDYLTETIRRMVEDYGADYVKLDYNQDCGAGTDYFAFCAGEGLEQSTRAYLQWVDNIRERFSNVLFETCSSGGMRMDYETLSHFSIISTSDQTDYLKYPYIAGNILSAVLPEQAAVWSYPVGVGEIGKPLPYDSEWVKDNITNERIIMNMINSFLGRMHLASHLELLTEEQFSFVKEGVEYYNSLTEAKKKALPYFPMGFTQFGADLVASGFETDEKIYLAVWNLADNGREVNIPLDARKIKEASIAYPRNTSTFFAIFDNSLKICFEKGRSARFFEIQL